MIFPCIVYRDPLTGLLNRRGLFETLDSFIQEGETFYLCYLDLNKFKFVNDTYGHNVGDRVLRFFAEEVQQVIHSTPHVFSRIGGDEIIVLIHCKVSDNEITKLFDNISELLQSVKVVDDDEFRISFSIGMACYPRDGKNIDDLINHADKNMYMDKQTHKKRFRSSPRQNKL